MTYLDLMRTADERRNNGASEEAFEFYTKAYDAAALVGDTEAMITCLHQGGVSVSFDYDRAMSCFQEAHDLLGLKEDEPSVIRRGNILRDQATTAMNAAILHGKQRPSYTVEAESYLLHSMTILHHADRSALAATRVALGMVKMLQEKYGEAQLMLKAAEDIWTWSRDRGEDQHSFHLASLHLAYARLMVQIEEYEKAGEALKTTRGYLSELGPGYSKRRTEYDMLLAHVAAKTKQWDEAKLALVRILCGESVKCLDKEELELLRLTYNMDETDALIDGDSCGG